MVIPEDADTIMPALPVAEKKLPGRERKTTCHRVKTWFQAPQLSAAAAPALEALKRLGCTPDTAIMVGDSPYDILCGQRAGCQTAAVRYSVHALQELEALHPTFMLNTLADLLPIVTA